MRLYVRWEYTLIAFSASSAAVCKFKRTAHRKFRLTAFAESAAEKEDPGSAIRNAIRDAGGVQGCIILCGDIQNSGFFRCPALPVPGLREQRDALRFELPRRLPAVPEDAVIQFFSANGEKDTLWNVFTFPEEGLLSIEALLNICRKKADELIYPLLAIRDDDPDIMLPRLEKDFVFSHGQWKKASEKDRVLSPFWLEEFKKHIEIPETISPEKCVECLLVMRMLISSSFKDTERRVRILPASLRPKRLRFHLVITIILALFLTGIHAKTAAIDAINRSKEFTDQLNERDNYRRKSSRLRTTAKKEEKEIREIQRILQLDVGEKNLLEKLADLSAALPSDTLVTSLRFNGSTADLVLQSENSAQSLPNALKGIRYWKIGQLQQRTMGDTLTMTTLKLVPAEDQK